LGKQDNREDSTEAPEGCLDISARADETKVHELLNVTGCLISEGSRRIKAWLEKTYTESDLSGDKCFTQERNASLSGRVFVVLSPFLVDLVVDEAGGEGVWVWMWVQAVGFVGQAGVGSRGPQHPRRRVAPLIGPPALRRFAVLVAVVRCYRHCCPPMFGIAAAASALVVGFLVFILI